MIGGYCIEKDMMHVTREREERKGVVLFCFSKSEEKRKRFLSHPFFGFLPDFNRCFQRLAQFLL